MHRATMLLSAAVLLLAATGANAIFTFTNNDDNDMKFSNDFFSVTKVKCFGAVISENNDEDRETEFDICVFGVVGGLIVLIGLYPVLLQQGAPAQFLRRQDNFHLAPPQFVNPYERQQQQAVSRRPTLRQRLSRFFSPLVQKLKTNTQRLTDSALERFGAAEDSIESTLYDIKQGVQQIEQQQQGAPVHKLEAPAPKQA